MFIHSKFLLLLLLTFHISGAMAQEIFEGTFSALTSAGGARKHGVQTFRLKIEISSINDNKIQGKISSPDITRCPNKKDEAMGLINGSQITLVGKTQPEMVGCGKLNFKGNRQGDSLIGTTFFNGADREIELKKK